ncbi:MAG: chromophore lyase CpcT/CpeT [Planctomycetes bacterium]|nr:chromophore lyase CpcT/CpeT [Planctomycetota bacterium]
MRTHLAAFVVSLVALPLTGCASAHVAPSSDLAEVVGRMAGTFSSRAQHDAAPDDYFDIRLVMVPVWTDRDDGPWLYVEQAIAQNVAKPYRQRVYHLRSEGAGRVVSDVFTLPGDPLQFKATWLEEKALCCIKPEDLTPRAGCSIHMTRREDSAWVGSTDGKGCASDLRGASYAESRVTLTDGLLDAWDQGFDATGGQVWGPTKGPYHFVRVSPAPPAAEPAQAPRE